MKSDNLWSAPVAKHVDAPTVVQPLAVAPEGAEPRSLPVLSQAWWFTIDTTSGQLIFG